MDKVNIAIVGYGNIAKTHALSISAANIKYNLPFELNLSHIVTARKDSVYLPNTIITDNIEEVLCNKDVDIIDICSVNSKHLESIIKSVEHKKAIYCEKPLTSKLADAKIALDLAEDMDIKTSVPFIFRYLPCVQMLKRTIEQKTLGEIIEFKAEYFHKGYLSSTKRQAWRTGEDAGGGALLDIGIHILDTIRHVFGEVSDIEHEKTTYFPNVAVDEICKTRLTMMGGVNGSFECSRVFAQRKQSTGITVFCEKGSIYCDFTNPYEIEINYFDGGTTYEKAKPTDWFMQYFASEGNALNFHIDGHIASIMDFARKVYNGSHSGIGADFREAYVNQGLIQV